VKSNVQLAGRMSALDEGITSKARVCVCVCVCVCLCDRESERVSGGVSE
jgi:hypothetical protein